MTADLLHEYTLAEQKEDKELTYAEAQGIALQKHPELNTPIENFEEEDKIYSEQQNKINEIEAKIDTVAKAIMKKDNVSYVEALATAQTKFPTLAKNYFEAQGTNYGKNLETNYSEELDVLTRYLVSSKTISFLEAGVEATNILS
jgi:hypothetical protein